MVGLACCAVLWFLADVWCAGDLITFWTGCYLNLCFVVGLSLFRRWTGVVLVCCVWLDSLVVLLLGLVDCCPFA